MSGNGNKAEADYLLTVLAAAQYLGVSRDKLSRMIKSGQLEAHSNPLDARQRLISVRQLDKFRQGKVISDPDQVRKLLANPKPKKKKG